MRSAFYVTEKLGPKQSLTPEGFLLCEEVPLARTGMMVYGPNETPIEAGPDGIVKIMREPEDVFTTETLASAQGKPVTDDHPEVDVTPENWKDLCHGTMLNVRRGEGFLDDLMIGDLLITTPRGIEAVRGGKVEVSLGYEADYDETGPGTGKQSNIIINHIALVDQGRCGPRCAISDRKPDLLRSENMSKKTKSNRILDALMLAFKAKDASEVEELAKKVEDEDLEQGGDEGGDTHIHVGGGEGFVKDEDFQSHKSDTEGGLAELRKRIEALESAATGGKAGDAEMSEEEKAAAEKKAADELPEAAEKSDAKGLDEDLPEAALDEIPEELKENAKKAKDSAYLADTFQDTVAMAEILVPGIRIPTFDRASKPGLEYKKICNFRRQALDLAYAQPASRATLDDVLGGKTFDTKNMTCDAVRTLFRSAASAQRAANNASATRKTGDQKPGKQVPKSLADINRMNAAKYGSSQ